MIFKSLNFLPSTKLSHMKSMLKPWLIVSGTSRGCFILCGNLRLAFLLTFSLSVVYTR